MRLIKRVSEKTYVSKDNGNTYHYVNYVLQEQTAGGNVVEIPIKPAFEKNSKSLWAKLEILSVVENEFDR